MKQNFIENLLVFVCAKGCMMGKVWIEPDKREFILYIEGQDQYVKGVLQGKLR